MTYRSVIITLLWAFAEARFGQEGAVQGIIAAVQGGEAGAAATLAGATISDLLGGANACAKLASADEIVAQLGGGADAIEAAIALVAAEKNTNPDLNGNAQKVCADPALPATEELRGITPLIDPAVSADVNALSAQTVANPLDATGKSVFDLIVEAGLGDFVVGEDAAGGVVNAGNAGAGAGEEENNNNDVVDDAADDAVVDDQLDCEDVVVDDAADDAANDQNQVDEDAAGNDNADGGAGAGAGNQGSIAGLDFGLCIPTIKFEGGLGGRPATEFTFQMIDPLAAQGQQEALNPNIITNRLCDQLGNVCEANDAAIQACEAAKAVIEALGTRDKSTADAWNAELGFAGAVTNPSGGPAEPPARRAKRAIKFEA